LTFGTAVAASAIVVAVFMAGLGLGGIFFGSKADKIQNQLKIFGLLEIGIGIFSFLLLIIFSKLPFIYKSIYKTLTLGQNISIFLIFVFAFILMLIPTFLMGGTFPVMSKVYIRSNKEIGKGVGNLYAINTLGGILGVFFTGFFFMRNWGVNLTQAMAIIINLLLGIVSFALLLTKSRPDKIVRDAQEKEHPDYILKFILVVAGLMGFVGMAYELFWIRAMSVFLANSTYTFTNVLIVFLTGITLGSLIFTKFLDNNKSSLLLLALCQMAMGIYVIISVLFLNKLPDLLYTFRGVLEIPVFRMALPGLVLSSVIMLVPTIFMGISFPLICKIYNRNIGSLGKGIGKIYFLNTIGCIIGPLVAGFILIPLVGVVKGFIITAFVNLFLGLSLTMIEPVLRQNPRLILIDSIFVIFGIIIALNGMKGSMLLPPSIYRTPTRSDRILYYKEAREGTVIVSEDRFTNIKACYINNSAVCGTTYDALKVVEMLGYLPFLVCPNAQNGLIIGFGTGITTSMIARHNIKTIDCVEICPGVRDAARYFANFNRYVFHNPKVNFIDGDGRNYLLLTDKKYDIISCDPTHPTLGCGNLYTKEYFELCKDHLNKGGVICQYLPLHKLSLDEFKSVIKTFTMVFPHATVWLAHSHGILLSTERALNIDFKILNETLTKIKDDILNDPYLIVVSPILDEAAVNRFSIDAIINTDNHPILEFFRPSSLKRENWEVNICKLMDYKIDPKNIFYNIADEEKLGRYIKGQKHFVSALVYKNSGDIKNVIEEYKNGLAVNPENTEIRIFLENELRGYRPFLPPGFQAFWHIFVFILICLLTNEKF